MFFNYDVLYRDGPMAIVWMAGNDEFASKGIKQGRGRKGKLLVRMLGTDLTVMCDLVKKYFPQMGSPDGLGLKKVATLVKGLGFIYLKKMDHLLQSMHEMNIKMQIPTKRSRGKGIDLPGPDPRTVRTANNNLADLQMPAAGNGWGDIGNLMDVEDIEFVFDVPLNPRMREPDAHEISYLERVVTSPSRSSVDREMRKRRRVTERDEDICNEADVMTKLTSVLQGISATANCLREDVLPPTAFLEDNAFGGDDFMFMDNMNMEPLNDLMETRQEIVADPEVPPPSPVHGAQGIYDDPIADEIGQQEGQANARVAVGRVLDMELEEIERPNVTRTRVRRGRRRSARLIIDEEIIISPETLHQRIREQRRPNDYDELLQQAAQNRAAIHKHSSWKMNGQELLQTFNRNRMGRQLTNFVTENARKIRVVDRPQPEVAIDPPEVDDADVEQRRMAASTMKDQSSRPVGADGTTIGAGGSLQPSLFDIGNRAEFMEESEEQFPTETFLPDADPLVDHDMGIGVEERGQSPTVPIFRKENVAAQDELILNEGETLFKNMFPPPTTSRKQAATAFFQLLRLKKLGKVELKQETHFGDIIVKKL